MAAHNLPHEGAIFAPQAIKLAKITIGAAAANDIVLGAQATYNLFNIPANAIVLDVFVLVETAFNSSVTLNIGDSTTTNGWMATAKVAPQTAVTTNIFNRSTLPTADTYAGGKRYPSATTLDVVVGGAAVSAGKATVLVAYVENNVVL